MLQTNQAANTEKKKKKIQRISTEFPSFSFRVAHCRYVPCSISKSRFALLVREMEASPPHPVFYSFSLSFFHSCLLSFQSTLGPLTLTSSVIWHFCFIALFSSSFGGDCTQSLTDKHRGIYHRLSNLHDPSSQKSFLLLRRLQMKTHHPGAWVIDTYFYF